MSDFLPHETDQEPWLNGTVAPWRPEDSNDDRWDFVEKTLAPQIREAVEGAGYIFNGTISFDHKSLIGVSISVNKGHNFANRFHPQSETLITDILAWCETVKAKVAA
jgi:hypothetical protein